MCLLADLVYASGTLNHVTFCICTLLLLAIWMLAEHFARQAAPVETALTT